MKSERLVHEEKISIETELSPIGAYYNCSVMIKSQNPIPILKLKIRVLYPNFLEYSRSFPQTIRVISQSNIEGEDIKKLDIEINYIKQISSRKIQMHFAPSSLVGFGDFMIIMAYEKPNGEIRVIKSEPIDIQIDKVEISPKVILSSEIREFSQLPGNKRIYYSLGIGTNKKLNTDKILDDMKNFFQFHSFQLITKDPDRGILWFCGTDIRSTSDILILCRIGSSQIEVILFLKKPLIIVPFLYTFSQIIQERLSKNKVIKPKKNIFELICVNCGSVLSYFPRKGESIICNKCNHEQIVW